jgi:hypothetical protein
MLASSVGPYSFSLESVPIEINATIGSYRRDDALFIGGKVVGQRCLVTSSIQIIKGPGSVHYCVRAIATIVKEMHALVPFVNDASTWRSTRFPPSRAYECRAVRGQCPHDDRIGESQWC